MASHDCNTCGSAAPEVGRAATVEAFDEALSEANIITDIIGKLSDGSIAGGVVSCASLYAWLADELSARLERIEVAGMTLREAGA